MKDFLALIAIVVVVFGSITLFSSILYLNDYTEVTPEVNKCVSVLSHDRSWLFNDNVTTTTFCRT